MRRLLLAVALSCLAATAAAAETYRFENGVVAVGDSIGELVQRAGKPDRTVQLENRYGGATGERWEYFRRDGKTVAFVISGSKVVRIEET